jgi:hypothetical protein
MARAKVWCLALVLACAPRWARAADPPPRLSVDQCNAESEEGQRQRRAGKLISARSHFRMCAREECPAAISSFCLGRLTETEAAIPSIVVHARDAAGVELADLDVSVNGAGAGRSDGRAIEVDPGPNAIHLGRGATSLSATTSVVIGEGEKLRPITLAVLPSAPAPQQQREEERERPPSSSGSVPGFVPYVLGGLGVVSAGAGAILWSSGLGARSADLGPGGCAPQCSGSDRDAIHTRLLVGDVLALVGVLSLSGAAYLFLRSPSAH